MTKLSLVSVIVPVYGVEPYLRRCVDSILGQLHQELEVLLVDDGSPDRCGEICDEYAELDGRVRVIHQENGGAAVARNAGIAVATGEWLVFVDADDWVHEALVGYLLEVAERYEVDIAACSFIRTSGEISAQLTRDGVAVLDSDAALSLLAGPMASLMTSSCGKLCRSRLLSGISYPAGRQYEDEFMTFRLIAAGGRLALSQRILYFYFERPDSFTGTAPTPRALMDRVDGLLEQVEFLARRGLARPAGAQLGKAFLLQRRIQTMARTAEDQVRWSTGPSPKSTARALLRSRARLPMKLLAALYLASPRLLDTALTRIRGVRGRTAPQIQGLHELGKAEALPPLEVIVVAYRSPQLLRRTLEAIPELDVMVVDNSSMAEIMEIAERHGCRYLDPGSNGGFASGVNLGLRQRRDHTADVLLLNPDAVITPSGVADLQRALHSADDIASVGPAQVDEEGAPIRVSWPFPSPIRAWLDVLGLSRWGGNSTYVSGAILLLRGKALDDVGHFDERFFLYSEEADWEYRAVKGGWRHMVVDSVTGLHRGGGTSDNESVRQVRFHSSQELYLRKHFGNLGWQTARAAQVLGDFARGLVRRGQVGRAHRARAALYLRGPVRRAEDLKPRIKGGQ